MRIKCPLVPSFDHHLPLHRGTLMVTALASALALPATIQLATTVTAATIASDGQC